jgi:hypothetical protein
MVFHPCLHIAHFFWAVKNFDYAKGYKFSTYATPIIKNKIIDALRKTEGILKTDEKGEMNNIGWCRSIPLFMNKEEKLSTMK